MTIGKSPPSQVLVFDTGKPPCSACILIFICSLHFPTESSIKYTKSVPSVYFLFSFSQFSKVLVYFRALRGKKRWNNSWNTGVISQFHFLATGIFPPGCEVLHSFFGNSLLTWTAGPGFLGAWTSSFPGEELAERKSCLSLFSAVIFIASPISAFVEGLRVLWDYFHSRFGGDVMESLCFRNCSRCGTSLRGL